MYHSLSRLFSAVVVVGILKVPNNVVYSCFEKGCLIYMREKFYATILEVIMGNGGFYGCLSEPQGVSAWWRETA